MQKGRSKGEKVGECACGNDLVYAGVGRLPERCAACRKAKKPLPRTFGKARVLDLQEDPRKSEQKSRHRLRLTKSLKRTLAKRDARIAELRDVMKSLTKMTKDRDEVLELVADQKKVVDLQSETIRALRAKAARSQKVLEVAATPSVTRSSKKITEVAKVSCPNCKMNARVAWRRTKAFDQLEGKCGHCGHSMNDIKSHGIEGVE